LPTIGEDLDTLRALNQFFKDNYPRIEKLFADCKIIELNKLDNERLQKQTTYEKLKYLSTY